MTEPPASERAELEALLRYWGARRDELSSHLANYDWRRPPPGRYSGLSDEDAERRRLQDLDEGHQRIHWAVGLLKAEAERALLEARLSHLRQHDG